MFLIDLNHFQTNFCWCLIKLIKWKTWLNLLNNKIKIFFLNQLICVYHTIGFSNTSKYNFFFFLKRQFFSFFVVLNSYIGFWCESIFYTIFWYQEIFKNFCLSLGFKRLLLSWNPCFTSSQPSFLQLNSFLI